MNRTPTRPTRISQPLCILTIAALVFTAVFAQGAAQDMLREADQILAEISNLRELEILKPVLKGVKNQDEIRAALNALIEKEIGAERVERERQLLVQLGLLPADYEYLKGVLDLLDEQVAGFYEPETKTLYIASWVPFEEQKVTLAHELMHALQDQHFDLQPFMKKIDGDDDQLLARKAIVEGEAVAVMLDYALRPMRLDFLKLPDIRRVFRQMLEKQAEIGRGEVLEAAPEFLRETLLFPYTAGARFFQVYRRWHPWKDVAKIYADPPKSTEQILHPEKYAGQRDDPTPVEKTVMDAQFEDGNWTIAYSTAFGEFGLYLMLKQFINEPNARQAARGWDGDAVLLLEHNDGQQAVQIRSVWDSSQHARQFFDACDELLTSRFPGVMKEAKSTRLNAYEHENGSATVELEEEWVTLVLRGPATPPERSAPAN